MELKIAFLIIVISVSNILAIPTYSQVAKVSLDMENRSLEQVMDEIERQSEFYFIFNQKQIDVNRVVDIQAENKLITDILPELFKGTNVNYVVFDRKILLTTDPLENNLFAIASGTEPQQNRVTGTVTDKEGAPIPGANVVVTGTTQGTMTDIAGKYSIEVPPGAKSLTFSFIGMVSQEITIGTLTQINITMAESAIGLEEVVVVGYGVQKKVNVIGSVISIGNKEISTSPVSSVSNTLAGRLPGVIVQQLSGQPGYDQAKILIRGNTTLGNGSPLIVVDGIPGRDLNSIESNDIENITVLKDASAAIYGAEAANGVILIQTKRGEEMAKPILKYEQYMGVSTPTMLPEMADAATYAQMIRETQTYRNITESNMIFSLEDIEKYKSGEYPWTHPNSNWFDAALRKYTGTHHNLVSVTGGTKNVKYYGSFGNQNDDAIYKNSASAYKRYNLRGNIDIKINEYLSVGLNINGSQENRLSPVQSAQQIFYALVKGRPTDPVIFPNGSQAPYLPDGTNTGITGTLEAGSIDNQRYTSENTLSATLKVPKIEGLTLSGYYVYDMYFSVNKTFQKPWINYTLNKDAYLAAGNTGKEDGSDYLVGTKMAFSEPRLTDSYSDSKTTMLNFKMNYNKQINGVHNITAFVAYESSEHLDKGISAFRRYFLSDKLPYLFAGGIENQDIGSSISVDSRINYFGRLSYNYKEKYLFEFTFRRDGSLRFSKEGRWGNFPSVLAGWRISNEDFWVKNIPFINYFKLRASWGQLGNDRVLPFQYLASYGFGTGTVFSNGKTYTSSLYQVGIPNPFITWEVANIFNVGFESYLFNSKIYLNFDYFYQRRNNILVKRNASVPQFTGISLPDENFGIVDSKGFETVLGYADKSGDFAYSINGNLAFARSKIIDYDEPEKNVSWQVLTGHPIGALLLYKSIGVFHDDKDVASYPHVNGARPGDLIIEDYNGDGKITSDDQIIFDKAADPEITFGININLAYKNWNLSALIQGVGSCMNDRFDQLQGSSGNYFEYDAEGRWTTDNITANKPRAWERTEEYWRVNYKTDYTFIRGDYARMKNLQLSYTIPKKIQNVIHLQNAELYVSGQNLFLIYSKSKLMDPELRSPNGYPLMKVYTFGTRIAF